MRNSTKERLERQGDRNKRECTLWLINHFKKAFIGQPTQFIFLAITRYISYRYHEIYLHPQCAGCLSTGMQIHMHTHSLYRIWTCLCDSGWTDVLWTLLSVPHWRKGLLYNGHSVCKCLLLRDMLQEENVFSDIIWGNREAYTET